MSRFSVLVLSPRARVFNGRLRFAAAQPHEIRVDESEHVEDVRKYDIRLSCRCPRAHFWIELIGKGAVRRYVLDKSTERPPW